VEWQLSQDGAASRGAWAADGRALYYVDASGRLMVIDVSRGDPVQFGKPRPVAGAPADVANVEAASDGRLVLMVRGTGGSAPPLTLVTGWQAMKGKE